MRDTTSPSLVSKIQPPVPNSSSTIRNSLLCSDMLYKAVMIDWRLVRSEERALRPLVDATVLSE